MVQKVIKVILIDFFGVICPDLTDEWLKDKAGANGRISRANIKAIDDRADLDKISDKQYYRELAKATGFEAQQVEDYFNDNIIINKVIIGTLKKLINHYKIIMISNSNSTMLRNIIANYELCDYFDEILISGEVGYMKPQPEIYQLVLDKFNLKPSEIIYIDDRAQNIEAAKQLGIDSIGFVSNSQLLDILSKY